jgi:hypothetical protein
VCSARKRGNIIWSCSRFRGGEKKEALAGFACKKVSSQQQRFNLNFERVACTGCASETMDVSAKRERGGD